MKANDKSLCQNCKSVGTISIQQEEQETLKGVMQSHPVYYKYCRSCHADFIDAEIRDINLRSMKHWVKESND